MFSWLARARGSRAIRTLFVAAVFLFGLAVASASAGGREQAPVVKVMTYNMDAGTDFLYFAAPPDLVPNPLLATYQEVANTNFRGRAGLMADAIASEKPALIGLQEVTLWETISATGRRQPIADQLTLLLTALWARHQFYVAVGIQALSDFIVPLGDGSYVHFLDRNVILTRVDLEHPIWLSNLRKGTYAHSGPPISGLSAINGWMSIDGRVGERKFRFFTTHLESPAAPDDYTQIFQGQELIALLNASPYPVILAGDFNSDATDGAGAGIDHTPTWSMIVQAGYGEVWQTLRPSEYGFTWPMYLEDVPISILLNEGTERIDLVFTSGTVPLAIERVGTTAPYPSDHAGVVATLQIVK